MNRRDFLVASCASLVTGSLPFGAMAQSCFATPQYPHPGLPDIAMITFMPQYSSNGLVILYNPQVVVAVGPFLSAFFEAHEYGHACLNHVTAQFYIHTNNPYARAWMSQTMELQADAFATDAMIQRGNITAIQHAAAWFSQQLPNPHTMLLSTHPPGIVRAQNIRQQAHIRGVQI